MSYEPSRIAEGQRTDEYYYLVASRGFDVMTGETDAAALQRYAAKRSRQTRDRLFSLIAASQGESDVQQAVSRR
ncbi:MAG: hypothetical protein QHC90_25340 [Shinella sp.]|nr:hypothetical protein [Shinella sp.]